MERVAQHRLHGMHILVVDDEEMIRGLIGTSLQLLGYTNISFAGNGAEAIATLESEPVDLVLADVRMPQFDGIQLLGFMKTHARLRFIPVVMVSASKDDQRVLECIELGAVDFLGKPINQAHLRARVKSCLEIKYLSDQEQRLRRNLDEERHVANELLGGALPKEIIDRLERGEKDIADYHDDVTVAFVDVANFIEITNEKTPRESVLMLNTVFMALDSLAMNHKLSRVKTVGDTFITVGGFPPNMRDHELRTVAFCHEAMKKAEELAESFSVGLFLRAGVATGSILSGVIGSKSISFDIWGHAVIAAQAMQRIADAGQVVVSESTCQRLGDRISPQALGAHKIKGVGMVKAYQSMKADSLQA